MLAIFSVPKPFEGHVGVIQRNAVRSWARLASDVEIVLCGDEPGVKEMAGEVGARHLPSVHQNAYGTPLLDSVFEEAERASRAPLMCYVNADILLLSDFAAAVRRLTLRKFLMVGQRWDVDILEPYDFGRPTWEQDLRGLAATRGRLHPPLGSDYFVFPRGSSFVKLPPFAVGRPQWDNWLIYQARQHGAAVVDVTRAVTVIHQNHGYRHVPGGHGGGWEGPEAEQNRSLAKGWSHVYTLADATHRLTPRWLMPALGSRVKGALHAGIVRCLRPVRRRIRAYGRLRHSSTVAPR
jgi:hypothetical protein